MLRKAAICALMATTLTCTALVAAGCGGSDDSTSEEDNQAITDLVSKLNQATRDKDASEFCLIMQPSAVDETFHDIDRCVSETKPILQAAGKQPVLKVESIEVNGDIATVTFAGSSGNEAKFVREDGQWYVPLSQSEITTNPDSAGNGG
ncbi:MAG: hypothetical protein KDB54_03750 [Solirubrobacterales bacterium]|nr:hypothetical protein [Solirubrobacterales bacterium]MCB0859746.1 hypothetical protein [Solirubrobacterales bacterium]HRV59816.1 hypothetical protein [Solirubrobacterales bacterium]